MNNVGQQKFQETGELLVNFEGIEKYTTGRKFSAP
jgi:hypothetical protein